MNTETAVDMPALPYRGLLVYCRPGFENDCAAELTERCAEHAVWGYCRAEADHGYVEFLCDDAEALRRLMSTLALRELVFPRQWALLLDRLSELPAADRASPIASRVVEHISRVSELFIEHPDTNTGKALSGFARKFQRPLSAALERAGVHIGPADAPRLHVFLTDSANPSLALSPPGNSAPWPMGILRLRMPAAAPSRSTLKLDEAFKRLLTEQERARLLQPGQRAVDLGASPGGWTWQLVQRGLFVTAVDNGPMEETLMASGQVEHLRRDAFTYRPRHPVDWLVCDIVDKPMRVADLMAAWLERGDCRAAVFNLKLPMRQRYASVRDALAMIGERLAKRQGRKPLVACKQLYHDREEVTAMVLANGI